MVLRWIVDLFVRRPFRILFIIAIFSVVSFLVPYHRNEFPNFADPQMGFETRGTKLSSRIIAWKNLIEATKPSGTLTSNPNEYLMIKNRTANGRNSEKKPKKSKPKKQKNKKNDHNLNNNHYLEQEKTNDHGIVRMKEVPKHDEITKRSWAILRRVSKNMTPFTTSDLSIMSICGNPNEDYVQFVMKSDTGGDLFNLESLQTLCRMERELTQLDSFRDLCIETVRWKFGCCGPWSLSNYVAMLHDRPNCLYIKEKDIEDTKNLLIRCSPYFYNLALSDDCDQNECANVPVECQKNNAVYNILNYITSSSFLAFNDSNHLKLEESMIVLPIACSIATLPFYKTLDESHLKKNGISVVAMELGIKQALFDEMLLKDIWYMVFGGSFIVICMWIYTSSYFLTLMSISAIVFALSISFFIYTYVFNMSFFPFMNLLTGVIIIGIGADDAFIFCKLWHLVKKDHPYSINQIMTQTMRHALISMSVTSITTAVAFLSSYLSSITALRCFGIFAGTTVITNYLLMITWLPASVILFEKYPIFQCVCANRFIVCFTEGNEFDLLKRYWTKFREACECFKELLEDPEKFVLDFIIKYKALLFVSLTGLALLGSLAIFIYPRLNLPDSNEFQLFTSSHPFEMYSLVYKNKFWFSKSEKMDGGKIARMPVRFVWGLLPVDNGNALEPTSSGTLVYDESFSISEPESQQWLLEFCKDLKKQSFYQRTFAPISTNCFLSLFVEWMERPCLDPIDESIDRTPCCSVSKFPFAKEVFDECIGDALEDLHKTPSHFFVPNAAGPQFLKTDEPQLRLIVVEVESTFEFSMSYSYVNQFVEVIDTWMSRKMESAPSGMKNGWYVSELDLYDLQRVLPYSTVLSVALSLILSALVLFFSTFNILTSLFAVFTICCSIMTTLSILVLMDWKLNVLESIAISSSIGLTVDYSLHYAVNYKFSAENEEDEREDAVRRALCRMLGPATMSAITTGAAGAFMIPSAVLAYRQIGQFLVIVMSVSWIYSTFHLGALFAIAGPRSDFRIRDLFKKQLTEEQPLPTTAAEEAHELGSLQLNEDNERNTQAEGSN